MGEHMSYLYILPFDTVFIDKDSQELISTKFNLVNNALDKDSWESIFLQLQKLNYRVAIIVPTEENPTYVLPYKNIVKHYFDSIFGKQQQYITINNIFCYAGKPKFDLINAIINDYNQTLFKKHPIKTTDFRDRVKVLHYDEELLDISTENKCQIVPLETISAFSQTIDFLKRDLQILKLQVDYNKIKTINTIASRYKKFLTSLKDEIQPLYQSYVQLNLIDTHYKYLLKWLIIYHQTLNVYIKKQNQHNAVAMLFKTYTERYHEYFDKYNKEISKPTLKQLNSTDSYKIIDSFAEKLHVNFDNFQELLTDEFKIYADLNCNNIQIKQDLESFYNKTSQLYQQKLSKIKIDRKNIVMEIINKLELYSEMSKQADATKTLLESTLNEISVKETKGIASLCQHNDYAKAKMYLNEMDRDIAGINKLDAHGKALLHIACYHGHYAWVKGLIVDYHAKVSVRSRLDALPLHIAAENNHIVIIKLLLEHGADVNAKGYKTQRSALHYAVNQNNLELMKLLFQHGAAISRYTADNEGRTALHYAVEKRNVGIIKLILNYRLHPSVLITLRVKSYSGFTPLGEAILNGDNQAIIDLLLAEKVALDREEVKLLTRIAHIQKRNDIHAALKLCENSKISWFKSSPSNSCKQKLTGSISYFLMSPEKSEQKYHTVINNNDNTNQTFSNLTVKESSSLTTDTLKYTKK